MSATKSKCKAHHFVWHGDDPVGLCKYCGAKSVAVSFDDIANKKSFSQGRGTGGVGINPIQHSSMKMNIRDVIGR